MPLSELLLKATRNSNLLVPINLNISIQALLRYFPDNLMYINDRESKLQQSIVNSFWMNLLMISLVRCPWKW